MLALERNDVQSSAVPSPSPSQPPSGTWYGNIQYLINISFLGALCCILLFLIVKLRSDQRLPGPASLATKLLAVWHTTERQIARLCGANSVQYLAAESYTFIAFVLISLPALLVLLPVNLYGGKVPIEDQFSKATVAHVREGSDWLWVHVVFMLAVAGVIHMCIDRLEHRLQASRYHDGPSADAISNFTLMIRGIPRTVASDKQPLMDYFEHRYPGKVFRIVAPVDLDRFVRLRSIYLKTRANLLKAQNQERMESYNAGSNNYYLDFDSAGPYVDLSSPTARSGDLPGPVPCSRLWWMQIWCWFSARAMTVATCLLIWGHCTPGHRVKSLERKLADLDGKLAAYKDGHARGSGIAFVIFKDIFTASRALQDSRMKSKNAVTNVSMVDVLLATSRWMVERAPPASDIHWQHLGRSTIERRMRTIAINAFLLLLLMFCSSPLAALTAVYNASHIVGPGASLEHVQVWLSWAHGSSWASTFFFQFLPNVLIFLSMYVVIPAALAYLSKFESHLTVSGEQQAVLVKTVCFFLVNLILLKALVETTLEAALMHIGQCYIDEDGCKSIKQLMNSTFLATSCLSTLAFLITSSLLGISFDLLAPIPWIKRKYKLLKTRGTRTYLVHADGALSRRAPYLESNERSLRDVLSQEDDIELHLDDSTVIAAEMSNEQDLQNMSIRTSSTRDMYWGVQSFDFAQYYAFNLTIFAMVLIYSTFAPIVVPFGALYFGYRYIVDKYNFLFVYRVRGLPVANDGKLIGTVLRLMRISMCVYFIAMLLFFSVRGDSERLQLLITLALLLIVCTKYGIEKLLSPPKDGFDLSIVQEVRTVDELLNGVEVEYETLSQPYFDWDSHTR